MLILAQGNDFILVTFQVSHVGNLDIKSQYVGKWAAWQRSALSRGFSNFFGTDIAAAMEENVKK